MNDKIYWIFKRGEDIVGVFTARHLAIEHLKIMVKQTLDDLKKQDKINSEFDYPIDYRRIQIYPIKLRPSYLGL